MKRYSSKKKFQSFEIGYKRFSPIQFFGLFYSPKSELKLQPSLLLI